VLRDVEGICECGLLAGSSFPLRDRPHWLQLAAAAAAGGFVVIFVLRENEMCSLDNVNVSDGKLAHPASASGVGSETHIVLLIIVIYADLKILGIRSAICSCHSSGFS